MPFQKGQSGNPSGGRREKIITARLITELKSVEGQKLHKLVCALLDKALDGDVPAMREVLDRVEGKAAAAAEDRDSTVTVNHYHHAAKEHLRRRLLPELAAPGASEPIEPTDGRAVH